MIGGSRSSGTVFRDFTLLMVMGFIAMIVWLLPFINPPGEDAKDATPVGNVVISVDWQPGNIDVDTWVYGPGELKPVGYSNRGGAVFNLLRDDLGNSDPDLNYESVVSRGIPAGRYWVNLHCFRCPGLPITANVTIEVYKGEAGKGMKEIATTTVELTKQGEEKTALSFELTSDGELVPGSMNSVFKPLRAMRHSGGPGLGDPDYGGAQ